MTTEDHSESDETVLSRRDALKGGSAVAATALLSKFNTGPAMAEESDTEPRLQLGDDWAIDDDSDGSGNNDLRLTHQPTGAELAYDVSKEAWIPSQPIGTPDDRVDHYGDTGDYNSVNTKERTVTNLAAVLEITSTQTIPDSTVETLQYDNKAIEDPAVLSADETTGKITIEKDGTYLISATMHWQPSPDWTTGDVSLARGVIAGDDIIEDQTDHPGTNTLEGRQMPARAGKLSQGDEVFIEVFQNSGTEQTVDADSDGELGYLTVVQIG